MAAVFPSDRAIFPNEFLDAGFCPLFDPHCLAISAACHNFLLHAAEYVIWCGSLYYAAFEAAGEAAVFQLTSVFRAFNVHRMRLHCQAPWNLIRGICNVFGRLSAYSIEAGKVARRYAITKKRTRVALEFSPEDFVEEAVQKSPKPDGKLTKTRQPPCVRGRSAGVRGRSAGMPLRTRRAGRGGSCPRRDVEDSDNESKYESSEDNLSDLHVESSGNEATDPDTSSEDSDNTSSEASEKSVKVSSREAKPKAAAAAAASRPKK